MLKCVCVCVCVCLEEVEGVFIRMCVCLCYNGGRKDECV